MCTFFEPCGLLSEKTFAIEKIGNGIGYGGYYENLRHRTRSSQKPAIHLRISLELDVTHDKFPRHQYEYVQ